MFCSKCGRENPDGAAFCQQCGNKMGEAAPAATPVQPDAQAEVYTAPVNPIVSMVKALASSPLFLVAAIAFSASVLFSIISSATFAPTVLYGVLDSLYEYLPYEVADGIWEFAVRFMGGNILSKIISSLPAILITCGLWMIFAAAKNRFMPGMKTGGFTLIRVITIISLVGVCLGAAAVEIILLVALIASAQYIGEAVFIFALLMVLAAIVYAFDIIYYAKVSGSLKCAKNAAELGIYPAKISGFVGVICFISAFFTLISGLVSLINFGGIVGLLSTLSSATASVCFGIAIFSAKKKFKVFGFTPNNYYQRQI